MVRARYRYIIPPEHLRKKVDLNNPRYERILYHIWCHRIISSHQLASLLYADQLLGKLKTVGERKKAQSEPIRIDKINKNLNALWHQQYIHKRDSRNAQHTGEGGDVDPYHLLPRGALHLSKMMGVFKCDIKHPKPPCKSKSHRGSPLTQQLFIQHELMVSTVLSTIQLYCAMNYEDYNVVYFCSDKHITLRFNKLIDGSDQILRFNPDGFICLEQKKQLLRNNIPKRLNIFLEIDRQTEGHKKWKEKLQAYIHLPRNEQNQIELIKEMYRTNEIPRNNYPVVAQWVNDFIMLTVTLKEKRQNNLIETTKKISEDGLGYKWCRYTTIKHFEVIGTKIIQAKESKKEYSKRVLELDRLSQLQEPIVKVAHQYYPDPFPLFRKGGHYVR